MWGSGKMNDSFEERIFLLQPPLQSTNFNFAIILNKDEPRGTTPLLLIADETWVEFFMKWNHLGRGGDRELQKSPYKNKDNLKH